MTSSTTNPLLGRTSTLSTTTTHTHTLSSSFFPQHFSFSLYFSFFGGRARIGRSTEAAAMWNSEKNAFGKTASFREDLDDEEALRWAALERLPTYSRARRSIFKDLTGEKKEIEVSELEAQERLLVLERLYDSVGDDPEKIFDQMRSRFDQ